MKLTTLTVENFRCYKEKSFSFHPEFNLVVGQNATGKTALFDATAVAIATWLLGFTTRHDKKTIEPADATLSFVDFSVWITVLNNDHDMRLQLIQAFKSTEESGCFDTASSVSISPAPNPDNLSHGSKI